MTATTAIRRETMAIQPHQGGAANADRHHGLETVTGISALWIGWFRLNARSVYGPSASAEGNGTVS